MLLKHLQLSLQTQKIAEDRRQGVDTIQHIIKRYRKKERKKHESLKCYLFYPKFELDALTRTRTTKAVKRRYIWIINYYLRTDQNESMWQQRDTVGSGSGKKLKNR
jgi:hypothetical protein